MYKVTLPIAFSEAEVIDDEYILETKVGDWDLQEAVFDFGIYMQLQQ